MLHLTDFTISCLTSVYILFRFICLSDERKMTNEFNTFMDSVPKHKLVGDDEVQHE
jgi:hypothetical protein